MFRVSVTVVTLGDLEVVSVCVSFGPEIFAWDSNFLPSRGLLMWFMDQGAPPAPQAQATDTKPNGNAPEKQVVVNIASEDTPTGEVVKLLTLLAQTGTKSLEGTLWQAYLNNTVRNALGLVAAEVWTDIDRGAGVLLQRKAYYVDPVYERLDEAIHTIGKTPRACAPGVGLAGVMWGKSSRQGETFAWTNLAALVKDEDTPDDARTQAIAQCFDLVTAIYLDPASGRESALSADAHVDGGLLLLYARGSAQQLLAHPCNTAFISVAGALGGTLLASSYATDRLNDAKRNRAGAWKKVRMMLRSGVFLQQVKAEAVKLESGESQIAEPLTPSQLRWRARRQEAGAWLVGYARKWRGVKNSKAPPIKGWRVAAAWRTFAWTFVGVFLTLLALSGASALVGHISDGQYFLMLGSFGALMALQYGAPNSPLAQPRNAIGGCLIAAGTAILVYYLSGPDFLGILPKSVAVALAPAISIATCQRVNLLHPPAGAAALIFVSAGARITDLGWLYLFVPLMAGNVVCCFFAMLINNLAKDRQYPVFW